MPVIKLCDDARWALEHYKNFKKIGLITDGYLSVQKNKVAALNIEKYFDIIVFSDELGKENWKPSPLPYQKVEQILSVYNSECVYIGDNPTKDFITAKKMGWITVQIKRNGDYSDLKVDSSYYADKTISSLFELKEIIT
jgi:putative hydrolase of the HAD superfamily